jgi:hypothetical protein
MLESWDHEASINMVRTLTTRRANVALERIEARSSSTASPGQAFEAGEVTLDGGGPPEESSA